MPTSVIGEARIGGHITGLVTEDGNPFDSSLLEKTFMLVYFGFTHCPDVCPEELDRMCMIKKLVGEFKSFLSLTSCQIYIDKLYSYKMLCKD